MARSGHLTSDDDKQANAFGSVLLGPTGQPAGRLRVRVQVLLTTLLVGTTTWSGQ